MSKKEGARMLHKFMHVFIGLSLTVLFSAQAASAVSFGQMDVASHLGEPFYAEMPLELGAGETLAKTSVELGGTSDYRILEVYRNQILNAIRVDIVDDERGTRAVLSSEAAIDAAFFQCGSESSLWPLHAFQENSCFLGNCQSWCFC